MKLNYLRAVALTSIIAFTACTSTNKNDSANADSASTTEVGDADNTADATFVNLSTGEPVTITRESSGSSGESSGAGSGSASAGSSSGGGRYVYIDSRKPIEADMLFVDVSSGDTLYGPSGIVVNNAITQSNGKWILDETKVEREGDEIKVKNGNDKLKMEDDEMKVKTGDSKIKVDGNETKVKTPTSKEKVDDDGETTIKPR